MNISQSAIVQSTTTLAQGKNADAVHVLMLKKALDMQASQAAQLIQSLPQPAQPALATSGPLGTRLNTLA